MYRIENPEYYPLFLLPILVWLIWLVGLWISRRRAERLGAWETVAAITASPGRYWRWLRPLVLSLASLLAVIALLNPQLGRKKEKVTVTSSDVYIILDISESMLATDVKPSRLERGRLFADRLIDRLRGDRIALVVMAGDAYIQVPLTTDYAAVKLFLSTASPQLAAVQGTDFAEAIDLCRTSRVSAGRGPGAVIAITDGENHEEGDIEAAKLARESGLRVYTVGIGGTQGAYIPLEPGSSQVKRDQQGNAVRTSLDRESIVNLARAGGGKSFLISDGQRVYDEIEADIDGLEKTESEQLSFAEYISYYQYFLGGAVVLFILYFLMPFGKMPVLQNISEE